MYHELRKRLHIGLKNGAAVDFLQNSSILIKDEMEWLQFYKK